MPLTLLSMMHSGDDDVDDDDVDDVDDDVGEDDDDALRVAAKCTRTPTLTQPSINSNSHNGRPTYDKAHSFVDSRQCDLKCLSHFGVGSQLLKCQCESLGTLNPQMEH